MKVENSKNNQVDYKQNAVIAKNEKSLFVANPIPNANAQTAAAKSSGSFAKILDEARHESAKEKEKNVSDKNDSADSAVKSDEKGERKDILKTEQKDDSEEKGEDGEGGKNSESDQENSFLYSNQTLKNINNLNGEISAPAARSILHVADLERIISQIRSQEAANQKEVLLTLKNSVLEGLQIKLISGENGNFKVEFLALNPEIQKQLKKRRQELFDILKQRSSKFSAIDVLIA